MAISEDDAGQLVATGVRVLLADNRVEKTSGNE